MTSTAAWWSGVLITAMAAFSLPSTTHAANTVCDWNAFALQDFIAPNSDLLKRERAVAMMQIAVYEAANAVRPTYRRSAIAIPDRPGASLDAAETEAAYETLTALFPSASESLAKERARQLLLIPESSEKSAGTAAGALAASAVLKWREHDGVDFSSAYTPGTGDGAYQPNPGVPVASPLVWRMRPFRFASYDAFRPPPPPPLDSPQMKRDLEEVATLGGRSSTSRTPGQTEIAKFHAIPGIYGWSSIARQVIKQRSVGEVESARILAVLETTVVDSHYAVWDAKFTYNAWRPVTALHAGGGPLHLAVDKTWAPLIPTPPHPEYPCAHCGLGSAAEMVLEGLFGEAPIDVDVTSGTITRHFHSFRQYAEEESVSRIYAGVHYRWSNFVGEAMGRQIGALELAQAPLPLAGTQRSSPLERRAISRKRQL